MLLYANSSINEKMLSEKWQNNETEIQQIYTKYSEKVWLKQQPQARQILAQ